MSDPIQIPESITFRPIGVVRTPYHDWTPHMPPHREVPEGKFRIELAPEFADGLEKLDGFSHVWVVSALVSKEREVSLRVRPHWVEGVEVGVFASRSPARPNPIGLSLVAVIRRDGPVLHVGPLDLLDGTPLLDLKPYIVDVDHREGSHAGWIDELEERDHAMAHLLGQPHDHDHDHDHAHSHEHDHAHSHEHTHEHAHDPDHGDDLDHAHAHGHTHDHDHDR